MLREFFQKLNNPKQEHRELPEDHWFKIIERLQTESGEVPNPLQIRARAIIDAFGLPYGPTSALERDPERNEEDKRERADPKKDRIIAEYLTNKAGVVIDGKTGITSSDFRDIYPKGLPEELEQVLDEDTRTIMQIEYEHAKYTRDTFGNTQDHDRADMSVEYFRLPGGINLFLRGYYHTEEWQKNHGEFLKRINKHAQVIGIEGFSDKPLGGSLELCWSDSLMQLEDYDTLMHDAVENGFSGLFTEVDSRDMSKIQMDNIRFITFPDLPQEFFNKYFEFLKKQHPKVTQIIKTPQALEKVLRQHASTDGGLFDRENLLKITKGAKGYYSYPYTTETGGVSVEPTLLELGQHLFTDAFSAIKLHLIAKLMADKHIQKGVIVDYEGAGHVSSKAFFLRYPEYAMEVVLRTINELMAGRVENLPEIYEVFDNPNWEEIIKEIVRIPFKQVENDPSKTTEIGPNQRNLLDYPVDILGIYNINPAEIMPTDKQIEELTNKLSLSRQDGMSNS